MPKRILAATRNEEPEPSVRDEIDLLLAGKPIEEPQTAP